MLDGFRNIWIVIGPFLAVSGLITGLTLGLGLNDQNIEKLRIEFEGRADKLELEIERLKDRQNRCEYKLDSIGVRRTSFEQLEYQF